MGKAAQGSFETPNEPQIFGRSFGVGSANLPQGELVLVFLGQATIFQTPVET